MERCREKGRERETEREQEKERVREKERKERDQASEETRAKQRVCVFCAFACVYWSVRASVLVCMCACVHG